ncbi:Kae1-like domain-containing protein [Yinghuangia aomiensis]
MRAGAHEPARSRRGSTRPSRTWWSASRRAARERYGTSTAALSGGVFGNAVLASACARVLRADGFTVVRHRAVPPNDGGLALGQLMVAARAAADGEESPCAWQCPAG